MCFITWLDEKKIKGEVMKTLSVGITDSDKNRVKPLIALKQTENGLVLEISDSMAKKFGITIRHKSVI